MEKNTEHLFLVEIEQQWSTSALVLVAGPSKEIAVEVAQEECELDIEDAKSSGLMAWSKTQLTAEDLSKLAEEHKEGRCGRLSTVAFIAKRRAAPRNPGFAWQGDDLEMKDFLLRYASPEAVAAARLARMEANNGQVSLFSGEPGNTEATTTAA
jgi:hypothetical protein